MEWEKKKVQNNWEKHNKPNAAQIYIPVQMFWVGKILFFFVLFMKEVSPSKVH